MGLFRVLEGEGEWRIGNVGREREGEFFKISGIR